MKLIQKIKPKSSFLERVIKQIIQINRKNRDDTNPNIRNEKVSISTDTKDIKK